MTYSSPVNPAAQISVMRSDDASAALHPDVVEVDDVDAGARPAALGRGLEVVHPLTDDPGHPASWCAIDGAVLNILAQPVAVEG